MAVNETAYQRKLVKKIQTLFPGCLVLKNDPAARQGIPDLLILFASGFWAMLEVKKSADAEVQPNQEFYVGKMNEMSFAAFIHPGNEEQVLSDLQSTFGAPRKTRLSKSK